MTKKTAKILLELAELPNFKATEPLAVERLTALVDAVKEARKVLEQEEG